MRFVLFALLILSNTAAVAGDSCYLMFAGVAQIGTSARATSSSRSTHSGALILNFNDIKAQRTKKTAAEGTSQIQSVVNQPPRLPKTSGDIPFSRERARAESRAIEIEDGKFIVGNYSTAAHSVLVSGRDPNAKGSDAKLKTSLHFLDPRTGDVKRIARIKELGSNIKEITVNDSGTLALVRSTFQAVVVDLVTMKTVANFEAKTGMDMIAGDFQFINHSAQILGSFGPYGFAVWDLPTKKSFFGFSKSKLKPSFANDLSDSQMNLYGAPHYLAHLEYLEKENRAIFSVVGVSGQSRDALYVADLKTGAIETLNVGKPITAFAKIEKEGETILFIGHSDGTVTVYNFEQNRVMANLKSYSRYSVTKISVNLRLNRVAVALEGRSLLDTKLVDVFDAAKLTLVDQYENAFDPHYSNDGSRLFLSQTSITNREDGAIVVDLAKWSLRILDVASASRPTLIK